MEGISEMKTTYLFTLSFSLAWIVCTGEFYCDISMYSYNVP
jgi:hypothetical protein